MEEKQWNKWNVNLNPSLKLTSIIDWFAFGQHFIEVKNSVSSIQSPLNRDLNCNWKVITHQIASTMA